MKIVTRHVPSFHSGTEDLFRKELEFDEAGQIYQILKYLGYHMFTDTNLIFKNVPTAKLRIIKRAVEHKLIIEYITIIGEEKQFYYTLDTLGYYALNRLRQEANELPFIIKTEYLEFLLALNEKLYAEKDQLESVEEWFVLFKSKKGVLYAPLESTRASEAQYVVERQRSLKGLTYHKKEIKRERSL